MPMNAEKGGEIEISIINEWDTDEIVELYRQGGWWKDTWSTSEIGPLIKGSFLFALAKDGENRAVGMGRVISDGTSDGYIQDLVVHADYRGLGIGRRILKALVEESRRKGLGWIGLIAEPGTSDFYEKEGFSTMTDHIPMVLRFDND